MHEVSLGYMLERGSNIGPMIYDRIQNTKARQARRIASLAFEANVITGEDGDRMWEQGKMFI
jgi:hypothetical protein